MKQIVDVLKDSGPLTGKELLRAVPMDDLSLWAACRRSEQICSRIVGRRYLRLDRRVEEYARLSPSIMREFYNYTVLGTVEQMQKVEARAEELQVELARISREKLSLAQKSMEQLVEGLECREQIKSSAAFMIAGDVVYGMAHAEPRPEISTGELVKGSDLDIIVVVEGLPEKEVAVLDAAIQREKYRLLVSPAWREEIDSIIKDTARVREQLKFQDFKAMVASKILHEADFLWGSHDIFGRIKEMVKQSGIPEKIRAMEEKAVVDRKAAEECLLQSPPSLSRDEAMKLFLTTEEKEEIF
ncbi:hypothetical protein [Dethiobacter alkaliphilus]|uniref:hypothetical protein n=1 Tax=Dethiobacter alkaliphilus TaxID=427926 RepID=UPI002226C456|nr:hypothetical protein [Dethiobacter alkaliphilus]MCW3490617.1 hypothetical protein [Dethiobacter alkaliphilus]